MFYLVKNRDFAVAQVPRCASQTIGGWLGKEGVVVANDDPQLLTVSRRIAFIRDPIDRLESAFSLFYWMFDYGQGRHVSNAPIDSWKNFIDHVLDPKIKDDEHWLSQATHVGNIPNIYHKLDNLFEIFEKYRPGFLPHKNKTSRSPLITAGYRLSNLATKYARDSILFEDAI